MIRCNKVLSCCLTAILGFSILTGVGSASPLQTAPAKTTHRRAPASNATPSQIADAKAKGLVWVNTKSGVYHTGGRYYGKTSHGQFMSLADAKKNGYKPAKR